MLSEVLLWNLCFILLSRSSLYHVAAFDATPRWGQATVVINDALYVYGGKTDEFNSFSYTSAPNNNDLLYLSLSSSFSASSPPWNLVSSSANTSSTQGPPVAWSILAAFNTSDILLFGGQPGPNSQTVIVDAADSAEILDVFSRLSPNWISEPVSWVGEPIRRIRHSAATAPSGAVFIFGGEKADGSNNAFSDHFVFNPNIPSFTLLPTNNGPPDLYGHTSIILSDGRILVFGGYSQSQGDLLSFSTIWVLDTKTLLWTVITTLTASLPSPRMAFAAVLIAGGKIIIHGGCDATLETNFADGWVLDTTQNPMTWTQIAALSQLGARRDHFAVASGNQVIFGFGYENSGPAPAPLQIFDPGDGTFVPTFTPPPAASMTQTLPIPSQTNHNTPPGSASNTGVLPTSTSPNNPPGGNSDDGKTNSTTAIAVGTAFGVMSLILVGIGAAYYVRRRHRTQESERQFLALAGIDDGDGDESPHFDGQIPAAAMHEIGESHGHGHGPRGILSSLGITGALSAAAKMRTIRNSQYRRRDMLADEDTRSFGEWYNSRRRDGISGSSWSLRSILGGGRLRSREASTTSHGTGNLPTPWREKSDPFSDGAAVTRDEETGFIGAAVADSRPRNRREMSYASYASSRSGVSYRDPFVDPIEEELREGFSPTELYADNSDEGHNFTRPTVRQVMPTPSLLPAIRTVLPLSQQVGQTLSPLSERTSQSTLPLQTFSTSGSSHGHSSENVPSPFPGGSLSQATSLTSFNITPTTPTSPPVKTSSIIGASDPGLLNTNQPMRRSDSWWSRFSRSNLLDRKSSDAGSRTRYDIRDPNPAPRLGPIEEASMSSTPGTAKSSPGSGGPSAAGKQASVSRANSGKVYAGAGHGKSMTSLRTADSEAIERMAGTMDVVQKERSRWGSGSTSSAGGRSVDTHASVSESGERDVQAEDHGEDLMQFASPVEGSSAVPLPSSPPSAFKATFMPVGPLHLDDVGPTSPSKVSERIQAYERRMSQDQTSPPPTNSKQREERSKKRVEVGYGLVPRPSLFVANPDHGASRSGDS